MGMMLIRRWSRDLKRVHSEERWNQELRAF